MRGLAVSGTLPVEVWRIFKERDFAHRFVHGGEFRLTKLRSYRTIGDTERRDRTEMEAHFQVRGGGSTVGSAQTSEFADARSTPGLVETHSDLLTPTYALCCSLNTADPAFLKAKFGAFRVRIRDPQRLATEICGFLESLPHKFTGGIEGCIVTYDKGAREIAASERPSAWRLTYSQKPACYSAEQEFRFVTHSLGSPSDRFDQEHLPISLGHALDYAEVDEI